VPFASFYGAFFLALGIYLPFWPMFLEDRGLAGAEIGLVLALGTWVKTAVNPVIGQIADRTGHRRRTMGALALFALLAAASFQLVHGFWAVLAIHLLLFPSFHSIIPLGESQAMAAVRAHSLDYGRLRLWGSITFILAVLGIGEVLSSHSPDSILWGIMVALALLWLTTLLLPRAERRTERHAPAPLTALLAHRRFLLFLATGALLQASHAVYYAFSAVHWKSVGISPATVGWLWSEGVVAEILLFAAGGAVLARTGPVGLLLLAAAGGLLRWSTLAVTTDIGVLAAAQILHGLTFGAAHLGAMHFIARTAPSGLQSTAQGLYSAVSGGIAMGLAMLAAGALYDSVGGLAFYAMAAMSAVAGVLALVLRRAERRAVGYAVP
jgi:PPP family 3-phenylpropionic acid transporter